MQETITERITYLENKISYYRSINDYENISIFSAVVNELSYWKEKYEPNGTP